MEATQRKKTRREEVAKPKNDDTTQTCKNLLDSNIYLTYDILRIIFHYLNSKDLSNAAVVCRSWREAANNERQIRGPVYFMEYFNKNKGEQADIFKSIRNLRINPCLGLYFISSHTYSVHFRNLAESSLHQLHEDCVSVILHTVGIIIDNTEMEHKSPNIACAFLPQTSDVIVHTFNMPMSRNSTLKHELLSNFIYNLPPPNHEKSTCLILFCNDFGRNQTINMAKILKQSYPNKITSIWGGMVKNHFTYYRSQWYYSINAYCVAILISGSIQTWSMIIDVDCDTKEEVEARLRAWKNRIKLKKHSMGFMFACRARGRSMYKKTNVESSIFKTLFPKVPLIGCFGDGEFGKNTIFLDELQDESCKNKPRISDVWYNEYSTVFMILTYG